MIKGYSCDTVITSGHAEAELYILVVYFAQKWATKYPGILRIWPVIQNIIVVSR
jgi:hypothetical protein